VRELGPERVRGKVVRHGAEQKVTVKQNFTGQLKETWKLPLAPEVGAASEKLIAEFWENGFGGTVEETTKGWIVRDAAVELMQDFLGRFQVHRDFGPVKQIDNGIEVQRKVFAIASADWTRVQDVLAASPLIPIWWAKPDSLIWKAI